MKKLKIRKIGNSLGAIFNAEMLAHLNVEEGDELFAIVDKDGLRLTPYNPDFEESMEIFDDYHKRYRNMFRKLAE